MGAFEAREKVRASIGRALRTLTDEADRVMVIEEVVRALGLALERPRSVGAERQARWRERKRNADARVTPIVTSTSNALGSPPPAPLSPTPPFLSSPTSTSETPPTPSKPRRNRATALDGSDPLAVQILRVVEAIDAQVRTRDPAWKGFPRTLKSTEHVRARLTDRGVTVDDLLLVVEWWCGGGQETVRGADGRVWDPWDHVNLKTPFAPGKFHGRLQRARAWRAKQRRPQATPANFDEKGNPIDAPAGH